MKYSLSSLLLRKIDTEIRTAKLVLFTILLSVLSVSSGLYNFQISSDNVAAAIAGTLSIELLFLTILGLPLSLTCLLGAGYFISKRTPSEKKIECARATGTLQDFSPA